MGAVLLALHLTPGRRLSATVSQWLGVKLKDPAKKDGVMATISDLLKANPWSFSLQDLAESLGCLQDDYAKVFLNTEWIMVHIVNRLAWSLDAKVKDMAHRQEVAMVRKVRSEGCSHNVGEQVDLLWYSATLSMGKFEWEDGDPGTVTVDELQERIDSSLRGKILGRRTCNSCSAQTVQYSRWCIVGNEPDFLILRMGGEVDFEARDMKLIFGRSSYSVKTVMHWDSKELRSSVSTEKKDGWYWHGVDEGQVEEQKYTNSQLDDFLNFNRVAALFLVRTGSSEECAVGQEEQNIENMSTSFNQMDISEAPPLFEPEGQQIPESPKVFFATPSKQSGRRQAGGPSPAAASTPVRNPREQKKPRLDDTFVSPIRPTNRKLFADDVVRESQPTSPRKSNILFGGQSFGKIRQGDFLAEDEAEIDRLQRIAEMANDMERTAAIIASRINMSLCRGVSSAARGQCLFECGSDQILHRVLWLAEEEGEENPLMFQELIDDIGMENLSAQSIREGTVDLLSNNEMAFERFPIETPGDEILPEEVRRERYAEEMEQLRRGGEYAMGAGDLMADGMSAFLGLYIIMLRSNTPDDHPIQLHIPQTMGGTLRHDMPLLVIYSENRSHYEEARPADMDSDQKLLFVEEIFLENNHWPYRYNKNDRKRKPQPDKDDDVPTPKRRKLFSLKSPAVPEVFSQEEEGEASSAKNAGKSSCKPQERGKKRDRSPSPTDGQPESNAALTTLRHVQGSLDAASNVPDKTNNQDVGSSRKMRKYEEELQKNLSPPEQQSLSIFRGQLNQAVADLPAFREELNEARLGNDTIIKLMSDFKDIIDGDDVLLHVQKKKSGTKKPETIKHWLTQLKGKILPFLHHKYPGIDLNILVDFKEEIEHDNYHRSDPPRTTKLFMLSETDIRESLNSTYNYLPNPGPSKHQLVMAWIALFRAIAKHAKSNRNWFSDRGDAQYTISNYDDAADAMAPAIKRFKGQAAEKRAEDELKGKTQPESVQLTKGVHNWYNSEQREKYRQTLAELADAKAVPTKSQYIQCLEFVHTEMIVSSPFRNAVWKGFPYRALAEASIHPGWDPSDVSGRDEETIETVIEDGYTFKLTADISRPPPSRACEHQRTNPSCTCPDACPPCGYNVLLTWDKGNKQATKNRYLHLPKELWEVIMQFARIRDNYFSCVLKNGPTGNQPSDWFKGNCPLLLNSAGKPNNAFTMSMASRVMQMDVTPHMFRKLFCTFLAHHEEESVRSAQSQVCGQSTSIFQQYYNLNKKRDAQTLIQLLQSWRTDPDVPSDSNSNWDEENQQRLLEEVKRLEEYEEEVNQVEDVIDTHSFKNPIMKAQLYLLLKIATRMDLNITVSHPNFDSNIKDFVGVVRLTKETWKMRFLKLAMRDSTNGETLRQLLLEIFKGREEPTRHKWSVMESMMTRQQSAKGKGKEEPQLWDSLWVLVDTIFSSVSAKVKAVSSISEDILYRECSCESLPKTLACIHCKKPVCNRCCR